jgi:hypothetical protein
MTDTKTKKTSAELRKFGLVMAVAFGLLGVVLLWRDKAAWPYLCAIGGFFLIMGLAWPRGLTPIEWLWMKMAHILGQIMTRVILSLAFFLVITPIGLIMKLFGRDPLYRKFDPEASSYWTPVDPDGPTSRPEKPY